MKHEDTDLRVRALMAKNITDCVFGTSLALELMGLHGREIVVQSVIALRAVADTIEKGVLDDNVTSASLDAVFDEAMAFHTEDVKRNG